MKIKQIISLVLCLLVASSFAACKKEKTTNETSSQGVVYFDGEESTELTAESIKKQVEEGKLDVTVSAGHTHEQTDTDLHFEASGTVVLGMESSELCALLEDGGFDTQSLAVRKVTDEYITYNCFGVFQGYYTNDDRDTGLVAAVYYDTAFGFETRKTTKEQIKQVMGEPTYEGPATDEATKMFLMNQPNATCLDYDCGNHHVSFYIDGTTGQLNATVLYQEGYWID